MEINGSNLLQVAFQMFSTEMDGEKTLEPHPSAAPQDWKIGKVINLRYVEVCDWKKRADSCGIYTLW